MASSLQDGRCHPSIQKELPCQLSCLACQKSSKRQKIVRRSAHIARERRFNVGGKLSNRSGTTAIERLRSTATAAVTASAHFVIIRLGSTGRIGRSAGG